MRSRAAHKRMSMWPNAARHRERRRRGRVNKCNPKHLSCRGRRHHRAVIKNTSAECHAVQPISLMTSRRPCHRAGACRIGPAPRRARLITRRADIAERYQPYHATAWRRIGRPRMMVIRSPRRYDEMEADATRRRELRCRRQYRLLSPRSARHPASFTTSFIVAGKPSMMRQPSPRHALSIPAPMSRGRKQA